MSDLDSRIVERMTRVIREHGLELLERYPNDLLVHDRNILERAAVDGAQIAWMVGHCHTHMVILGLHPDENQNVGYLTNLSSSDHFYLLKVKGDAFTMQEVGREAFARLSNTSVPYARKGVKDAFWLLRNGVRVGYVRVEWIGTLAAPRYKVTLTPVHGCSALDLSALYVWGSRALAEVARSLFTPGDIVLAESEKILQAA